MLTKSKPQAGYLLYNIYERCLFRKNAWGIVVNFDRTYAKLSVTPPSRRYIDRQEVGVT
jgi:hypothetical protein